MSRTDAVRLKAVGAPVALLAGCNAVGIAPTSASPPATLPPLTPCVAGAAAVTHATAPAALTATPTVGGTLRMAQPLELSSLDGRPGFTGGADTLGQSFDRLTDGRFVLTVHRRRRWCTWPNRSTSPIQSARVHSGDDCLARRVVATSARRPDLLRLPATDGIACGRDAQCNQR